MSMIKKGIPKRKKILIISPDALPLKYHKSKIEVLEKEERELFVNKVTRATALGNRAYNMANQLAKTGYFEVTVAVPHYNYFNEECINTSECFFSITSYNYDNAMWKFSDELADIIEENETVILQTTAGVGFINCIECNKELIIDGWVPLGIEFPTSIGSTIEDQNERKKVWDRFKKYYFKLFEKANVVLFANLSQKFYYFGILSALDSINYKNYKHSKLLKVGLSVDSVEPFHLNYEKGDKLNLLWFGSIYPWYNPYILLDAFGYLQDKGVTLTFAGFVHPRYNSYNRKFYSIAKKYKDITLIPEYTPMDSLKNFHLSVILSFNYLEKDVSHRCRFLNLAAHGIPLCTNKQDNVGVILQKYGLSHLVSTLTPKDFSKQILRIRDAYSPPRLDLVKKFQKSLSHEKCYQSLIGYLSRDKKWKLI